MKARDHLRLPPSCVLWSVVVYLNLTPHICEELAPRAMIRFYIMTYNKFLQSLSQGWIGHNVMLMLQLCQSEILEGCQPPSSGIRELDYPHILS